MAKSKNDIRRMNEKELKKFINITKSSMKSAKKETSRKKEAIDMELSLARAETVMKERKKGIEKAHQYNKKNFPEDYTKSSLNEEMRGMSTKDITFSN